MEKDPTKETLRRPDQDHSPLLDKNRYYDESPAPFPSLGILKLHSRPSRRWREAERRVRELERWTRELKRENQELRSRLSRAKAILQERTSP